MDNKMVIHECLKDDPYISIGSLFSSAFIHVDDILPLLAALTTAAEALGIETREARLAKACEALLKSIVPMSNDDTKAIMLARAALAEAQP